MAIRKTYTVFCDYCNNMFESNSGTKREMIREAKNFGWQILRRRQKCARCNTGK